MKAVEVLKTTMSESDLSREKGARRNIRTKSKSQLSVHLTQ